MENFEQYFENEGYTNVVKKGKSGICGIFRFAFTTGLVIGMRLFEYYGRYCYDTKQEAIDALEKWDGNGDPPGNWIKYKGYGGERSRIPEPEFAESTGSEIDLG